MGWWGHGDTGVWFEDSHTHGCNYYDGDGRNCRVTIPGAGTTNYLWSSSGGGTNVDDFGVFERGIYEATPQRCEEALLFYQQNGWPDAYLQLDHQNKNIYACNSATTTWSFAGPIIDAPCTYDEQTLTCSGQYGHIVPGDATGDGLVNVLDVVRIVDHLLGNLTLVQEQLLAADYNRFGTVNVNDVVAMVDDYLNNELTTYSQQQQQTIMQQLQVQLNALGVSVPNQNKRPRQPRRLPVQGGQQYTTLSQQQQQSIIAQVKRKQGNAGSRSYIHTPTDWSYQQTTLQTFFMWFRHSLYPLGDGFTEPSPDDVIAYFVGDTCVGWAYTEFVGEHGVLTLPMVMDDGSSYSSNYPNIGDPIYSPELNGHFKYYRADTGEIFEMVNANLCEYLSNLYLENNLVEMFDGYQNWLPAHLIAGDGDTTYDVCFGGTDMTINLDFAWNLVSFPLQMTDNSLSSVLGTNGTITNIVGDGVAAQLMPDIGWAGSLSEINPFSGYWVESNSTTSINISGSPIHSGNPYNLNAYEWTLVSYPFQHSQDAGCTLNGGIPGFPNDNHINNIVGEGVAIQWSEMLGLWVGDLQVFEPGTGYWVKHKGGTAPQMRWNDCSATTTSSTNIHYFKFTYPENQYEMGIGELSTYLENQIQNLNIGSSQSDGRINKNIIGTLGQHPRIDKNGNIIK